MMRRKQPSLVQARAAEAAAAEARKLDGSAAVADSAACLTPHAEFRIAVVLPWVTEEHSATRFPPWLPYFVASARHR